MNRTEAERQLRLIWASLPAVPTYCRGLCADSCGGGVADEAQAWEGAMELAVTPLERRLIEAATGAPWKALAADCRGCSYWNPATGLCGVYDVRPTVCRLYGADPDFPCTHGCTPVLPEGNGFSTLRIVAALSRSTA